VSAGPVPTLAWPAVCGRRLARHGLATPVGPDRLVEQVGIMCGAHAQVMAAAELSIGLRVEGATRQDVRRALWEERTLVKTCGPRGTIHLLPATDLPQWTAALASAPAPNNQAIGVRLSDDQTDEVVAAIADALVGVELTVEELGERVVERTGPWAAERVLPAFQENRPRWQQALQTAAFRGAVCYGPNRGRRTTYTSPATWLPGFAPMATEPAGAAVVRSFLHAYGPATDAQVARWLAVPLGWVKARVDSLGAELEAVRLEGSGEDAWVLAGDTVAADDPAEGVRLLPYFDAYGVGAHPRSRVFPGVAAERALANNQAGTVPVLLVDGLVAGVWHQRRTGKRLAMTVEPFARLTARRRRELDDQVARVGEILEATPDLTIGEVTTGGHL
jgi:winged helix DNA-binding protein